MEDTLKAGSNQGAERAAEANDFALSVAIGGESGERIQQIWRRAKQKEKGIWSKMEERQ
jgi:hypothetical protein